MTTIHTIAHSLQKFYVKKIAPNLQLHYQNTKINVNLRNETWNGSSKFKATNYSKWTSNFEFLKMEDASGTK